jgi:hypothetical protein
MRIRPPALITAALACAALITAAPASASTASCAPAGATWSSTAPQTSQPFGSYQLASDMWGAVPGSAETIWGDSLAGSWGLCGVTEPPGGDQVKAFSNATLNLSGEPQAAYNRIRDMFSIAPLPAGADAQFMNDMWVNGLAGSPGAIEIEVVTDRQEPGVPYGTPLGTADLFGQDFGVYRPMAGNRPYYSFVLEQNETSGTMHDLAAIRWLIDQGQIPASSRPLQVDVGYEIVTAGSPAAPASFTVNQYSTVVQMINSTGAITSPQGQASRSPAP